jgi:hypothetical protein
MGMSTTPLIGGAPATSRSEPAQTEPDRPKARKQAKAPRRTKAKR